MAELDSNSTEKAKNKEAAQNAKSKSIRDTCKLPWHNVT